ncbi:hypothetical protein E2542_SST12479 [Spatholobus suberectus]|nr:hypothetical protein E2542_SST12479 [Spatholobus suberectus]
MRNIFKTQDRLFKTMISVENHRRQKLTKVMKSYNLITTEYTSRLRHEKRLQTIFDVQDFHRATNILLRNPDLEGRYNLNQPLKERNQGYLSKGGASVHFLSIVRIHSANI